MKKLLLLSVAGIVALSLVLCTQKVQAATTTYDVHNVPDMTLDVRITSATTSGIRINWPTRNGVKVAFPTGSGVVLEFKSTNKTEQIYASRIVNDATTETFTLSGTIIRDLDWNDCSQYVTDGNAQTFTPGATKVREVVDCRILNRSAKIDRNSTTTGSGAYTCGSTSQACLFPGEYTTTQRNAFTYGANKFQIIYDSTVGAPVYHVPGQPMNTWITLYGSGTLIINGTESVKGVFEGATIAEQIAGTATGSTAAYLVVLNKNLVRKSSGSADAGKLFVLDANGTATGSVLARNADQYSKSGAVVLSQRTISGSYAVGANQNYVPLAPIGSIMMWPTETAPNGWILCDGKAHTRTGTGAALFAVIGTTFGVGDGATTFNVPDMRGRFPLGQDDMGGTSANRVTDSQADTVGSSSGSLTFTTSNHTHSKGTIESNDKAGGGGASNAFVQAGYDSNTGPGGSETIRHIPNYLTINYIIRAR